MRIKISMLPVQDRISRREFELYYREAVNGWIYSMLEGTGIHEEHSPVKFCFSSLRGFEPGDTELRNDRWITDKKTGKKFAKPYYFLISTPRKDVAYFISKHLIDLLDNGETVNLKDAQFRLVHVKLMNPKIIPGQTYCSDGPVIFKMKEGEDLNDFFRNHLEKKYKYLNTTGDDVENIHKYISIDWDTRKKIVVHLFKMENKDFYKVNGYKLQLKVSNDVPSRYLNIYKLIFDSGLGSYTTFGCGFININTVKKNE